MPFLLLFSTIVPFIFRFVFHLSISSQRMASTSAFSWPTRTYPTARLHHSRYFTADYVLRREPPIAFDFTFSFTTPSHRFPKYHTTYTSFFLLTIRHQFIPNHPRATFFNDPNVISYSIFLVYIVQMRPDFSALSCRPLTCIATKISLFLFHFDALPVSSCLLQPFFMSSAFPALGPLPYDVENRD